MKRFLAAALSPACCRFAAFWPPRRGTASYLYEQPIGPGAGNMQLFVPTS